MYWHVKMWQHACHRSPLWPCAVCSETAVLPERSTVRISAPYCLLAFLPPTSILPPGARPSVGSGRGADLPCSGRYSIVQLPRLSRTRATTCGHAQHEWRAYRTAPGARLLLLVVVVGSHGREWPNSPWAVVRVGTARARGGTRTVLSFSAGDRAAERCAEYQQGRRRLAVECEKLFVSEQGACTRPLLGS